MRRPPRSTEERLVRAQKSMMPGTLGGRVASASPMALDVTRLDPRLRAQKRPAGSPGGGFDPNADPVVIGSGANGNGFSGSVVGGLNAYGNAYDVVVWGDGADAESDGAVAVGANSYVPAGATDAVAVGYRASAAAANAITIGRNAATNSSASGSIAIGSGTVVRDANATAVGQGAFIAAGHTWSTALGHGTVTTKAHQIMLGTVAEFVEIAGSGIVFTDTITGTRKMLTLASGGVSWVTAP